MKITDYSRITAAVLKGDDALRGLVGDKVFPIVAPRGVDALPCVTYRQTARDNDGTKDGSTGETTRVEVSFFSTSYAELVAVADAAEAALLRYDGGISYTTGGYEEAFDLDAEVYIGTLLMNID